MAGPAVIRGPRSTPDDALIASSHHVIHDVARAWANRVIAVAFCVPAIPYMWLRDEKHFARKTAKAILLGRGKPWSE